MLRPSVFAVCRLMTSSTLTVCLDRHLLRRLLALENSARINSLLAVSVCKACVRKLIRLQAGRGTHVKKNCWEHGARLKATDQSLLRVLKNASPAMQSAPTRRCTAFACFIDFVWNYRACLKGFNLNS